METLKFSTFQDDHTQTVSRNGIKLATIFYDFKTIVFEQPTRSISFMEVTEISNKLSFVMLAEACNELAYDDDDDLHAEHDDYFRIK